MMNNIELINYIVRQTCFGPHEKLVSHTLIYHRNTKTGQCNPSVDTLCYETGLSESSVRRATRFMADFGFLTKVKRGRSNWYGLQIPVRQTETPVSLTPKPLKNLTENDLQEAAQIWAEIDEAEKTEGIWRRGEASAYSASLKH